MTSFIFLALGLLYLIAFFVEIPLFYMGNPKTRFFIEKMGKRNYKIMLLGFAIAFIVIGIVLR